MIPQINVVPVDRQRYEQQVALLVQLAPGLSPAQLHYVACLNSDPRMNCEARLIGAALAYLSGPMMDRAASDDEITEALAQAATTLADMLADDAFVAAVDAAIDNCERGRVLPGLPRKVTH